MNDNQINMIIAALNQLLIISANEQKEYNA